MRLKKGFYIALFILVAAFFAWRFIRPLNIFVIDEKFAMPIHLDIPQGLTSLSAEECGRCHEETYHEWADSMHAKAWTDPYFQVDFVYDGSMQICLNCHIPLENQQEDLVLGFKDREKFKPLLKPNPDFDPKLRDEGVTCAVCHVREGRIVGPFKTDTAPHPLTIDPEMSSGMKSCERCHVVSGKRWDIFYRVPPCGTVAEIEDSGKMADCIGCHMPEVTRSVAKGMIQRKGGAHLFWGGHRPEMVKKALKVEYKNIFNGDRNTYEFEFRLINVGAYHYLPTGTPDRHLTLELRLLDNEGTAIKETLYKMKRYILWRPFIVDIRDTRLPYNKPRKYIFDFKADTKNPPSILDASVRYHLLDEKRRKKIGYENTEPIAYSIYKERIPLNRP
jgi:hypothetical protein